MINYSVFTEILLDKCFIMLPDDTDYILNILEQFVLRYTFCLILTTMSYLFPHLVILKILISCLRQ